MSEVDRLELTRNVYRRLAEPAFRRGLASKDNSCEFPLVIASPSDTMEYVLDEVITAGGTANVVVGVTAESLLILGIDAHSTDRGDFHQTPGEKEPLLTAHCTVGVFIERLKFDAPSGHFACRFVAEGPEQQLNEGVAEMLSLI